jgi:hypothetical protein
VVEIIDTIVLWLDKVGIILILQTKVVGLAFFIPIRIPKGWTAVIDEFEKLS